MNIYINNSESESDLDLDYDSDNTDTQSVETNEDIDKYMYNKNMNISLKKLFGPVDNNEINELKIDWESPLFHGLKNSEPILPNYYYINKDNPLKKIEYIKFIKETINDLKILNKYQLEYIESLPASDMFDIINTFNMSNKTLYEIIEWGK